jgi:hypothetical protein
MHGTERLEHDPEKTLKQKPKSEMVIQPDSISL